MNSAAALNPDRRLKRVGIVTFHFVPNYGAVWQAFALQQTLTQLGHHVEVVDYRPRHVFDGGGFWVPCSRWRISADVVIAYQHLNRLRRRFSGGSTLDGLFERFIGEHLLLGKTRYQTERALRGDPPDLDAVVCGSDQIWNPSRQRGTDPMYFLDFVPPGQRRVAYAASFGRAEIEPEHEAPIGGLLRAIGPLSVRERSGVNLCRKLAGREDARVVPDPTLLRETWPEAERHPAAPSRYLFSYVLRSAENIEKVQAGVARGLGLEILQPVTAHSTGSDRSGTKTLLLSPAQWLGAIRDAEAVVTNSFHGTIFSVLFERPFLTISIGTGKQALNERAASLLEQLGLLDRFHSGQSMESAREALAAPIDWAGVRKRVAALRADGFAFLEEALSGGEPSAGVPHG